MCSFSAEHFLRTRLVKQILQTVAHFALSQIPSKLLDSFVETDYLSYQIICNII